MTSRTASPVAIDGAAYLGAFEMTCWPRPPASAARRWRARRRAIRSVDTWCDRPFVDGVVLVGDAAGHNDPLIGQGLSITSADVRSVTGALLSTDDWSAPGLFDDYGRERAERMRRLRNAARCARAGRRRPLLGSGARRPHRAQRGSPSQMMLATMMVGPSSLLPDDVHEPESIERLLADPR